ncbi:MULTISPECIES: phosphatidylserine decarboxylase family protein [Porphyromonas]|uniref:Phosphatidylserine decarboxylase proenzyme n=1 Tax=Porphyromonas canoris TaxID=36875 RepID=A0ABR4XNE4_9PORP|nr:MULTISPECIES: phosphatidylserine decarboxylase family protein [Porphyromonas]KGN71468.1 phosphatidylserine decarboxylase [Porphyromonas sp. COT-108 OH1349]KGN93465.1 phosphatidylserine decarboxylase [Porphyromonas canoris]KGN95971.1 phosphatidylserine decarboxylase [Porphyromonas sp. COT-108 OH2963]
MMKLRRNKKIKLHREGVGLLAGTFVLFFFVVAYLYAFVENKLAFYIVTPIALILFLLEVNFFRSPLRKYGQDTAKKIVAPADGKIVAVEEVYEPEVLKCNCIQISVFMSVFNVHANWYPVDGFVRLVRHHQGRFMAAYLPKSSVENERSTVVIETECGRMILARQIAGAVAKRIITYAKEGEECYIDEHMGFIKFGSRVDVYVPLDSTVKVEIGQVVTGNQTLLAELS